MRKISALLAGLFILISVTRLHAQPAPPVGVWNCVVNSPVVSIELQMQVNHSGGLAGRGTIVYNGTSAIYQVQGYGDWVALPPDGSTNNWLFKFRMHPQNHAIFSWFAAPTGSPGYLYNVYRTPQNETVETACQQIG